MKSNKLPILGEKEPDILGDEVRKARNMLRKNKAPGADGITAEIIKAAGYVGVDMMYHICNGVWLVGTWPEDCDRVCIHHPTPERKHQCLL